MTSGGAGARRPPGGWPGRGVSLLNGIAGDYLARRGLPWSIAMTFVQDGRPLALNARSIVTAQPQLTGKLVVLVHGWCCSEDIFNFASGATYATLLQRDAGYVPFAVRYNTGMPIAESGRDFARLLRALVAAYPLALDEIVLIGHSMGGLVIRAACHAGAPEDAAWTAKVRHAFYLGTPHDDTQLERFALGATRALRTMPNPVARLVGNLFDARGEGSRDGRHIGEAPTDAGAVPIALAALPWLASARHWQLVGTITDDPRHPVAQAFGDGLVRMPQSATSGPGRNDAPAQPRTIVLPGVHHLQLARDAAVYDVIRATCSGPPARANGSAVPV